MQGLEVGSPVKFRGVRIGRVLGIRVASNRRHVEVECAVDVDQLVKLGLRDPDRPREERFVPPDLRVQLVSPGIAGGKFLQIDFFDPKRHPPPSLPFPTPKNYIPATESTLKSLEESIVHTTSRFPKVLDQTSALIAKADKFLTQIDAKKLSDQAVAIMDQSEKLLKETRAELKKLKVAKLTEKGRDTLKKLDAALDRSNKLLARIEKKGGMLDDLEASTKRLRKELDALKLAKTGKKVNTTLDSVKRTSDALGRVTRDNRRLGEDLEATLKAIRKASGAVRKLADTLERDSDMLLKGRRVKK